MTWLVSFLKGCIRHCGKGTRIKPENVFNNCVHLKLNGFICSESKQESRFLLPMGKAGARVTHGRTTVESRLVDLRNFWSPGAAGVCLVPAAACAWARSRAQRPRHRQLTSSYLLLPPPACEPRAAPGMLLIRGISQQPFPLKGSSFPAPDT